MKRKIVTFSLAAVIGTSGLFLPNNHLGFAQTLQDKKEDIEKKQSDVSTDIEEKESEIAELEEKEAKLNKDIETLDTQFAETTGKIREQEANIKEVTKEIEQLKAQIEEVKARIEERNELLEDRARSLQQSGGMISYLDVLLGAQSFGDFVGRVNAVSTIVEADREIIKAHEADKQLLEQSEADLNNKLKELQQALTNLEDLKKQLASQKKKKEELMAKVMEQQEEALHDYHELEDEATFLAEQKRAIEAEEKRQREEAARAAAAAEAKRKAEAAAAAANSSNSSASSSSGSSSSSSQKPAVSTSGDFMWPASGRRSSEYGYRIHPVTGGRKLHSGIDIANGVGTPIYAAASGTVIRANYSSSYGNVVYISHNINGQVYTTVYAHQTSLFVRSGQSVSKGQQIGTMGSTGRSTGSHLHFEIHKGAWNGSASAVNPRSYLP